MANRFRRSLSSRMCDEPDFAGNMVKHLFDQWERCSNRLFDEQHLCKYQLHKQHTAVPALLPSPDSVEGKISCHPRFLECSAVKRLYRWMIDRCTIGKLCDVKYLTHGLDQKSEPGHRFHP